MGKCELNDYGVEDETSGSIEKGELEKKEGFVYSQLRPAGVSLFSLLHKVGCITIASLAET